VKLKSCMQMLFILLTLCLTAAPSFTQRRDGKLLRSQAWQPFDAQSAKGDFFVSPQGQDSWSGTLAEPNAARTDGPFATLERAQRAVRDLKARVYQPKTKAIDVRYVGTSYPYGKGKDIVVLVREGFYSLPAPLRFTPEDGGERVETNLPSGAFEWHHLRDHYVTYAAYPGEKPVISGACRVTQWQQKDSLWLGSFAQEVPALLVNGQKQTLARTPNTGYYTLASTPSSTSEIPFKRGDIRSWPEMEDNRIVILLRWRSAYNAIERVDEKKRIAWLRTPEDGPGGHNGLLVVPPRYFVENIKALLDSPGEWFYDKTKNEISYLAPAGLTNPNAAILSVPQINRLIQVQGEENRPVRNLRFYNLIFEGAKENFRTFPHHYDATPGCIAVSFEYAHDCEFADSELRACGGLGMEIGYGCYQTRVFGNRFDGLEQGALAIIGTGDGANGKLSQMNRETKVTGNIFSNCGQGGGITLSAFHTLRTIISHNYFTKTGRPYTMDVGGGGLEGNSNGECIVEYNHFDDVQTDADDAGVIVVNGMTYNSSIRRNLIHGVERGFFSDNVAFWFDNMSSGWKVENNIYYDLEQAAMKTCGTYLSDNIYQNNFTIEPPANAPEQFINGDPDCACSNLQLSVQNQPLPPAVKTGSLLKARAEVYNNGSSGITTLTLYANRKPIQTQPFPIIRHNRRTIEFDFRLNEPGLYEISINETQPQTVTVQGLKPEIVYDKLLLSEQRVLAGQPVQISASATNLQPADRRISIPLLANGREIQNRSLTLKANSTQPVSFEITPQPGDYAIQIGNSETADLKVLHCKELDVRRLKLQQYISPKAKPASINARQSQNHYTITASGWDFYHAEDAYATVYLKALKGDFIATVQIASFGEKTNDWYRAGLFARNDISKSFDVDRGSKGSVLLFSTPNRAGIEYDEFGDGCMHKAASENLPENSTTPLWLRWERHGNRFTGYISLDGKTWLIKRQSNDLPGLAQAIDLGLAAGSPDQKPYTVEFKKWEILVEEE